MIRSARSAFLAGAVLLLAGGEAQAHHSYAAFDRAKTVEVAGTVKSWEWTNPHVWLTVSVPQKKGPPVDWAFEGLAPGTLRGKGWLRTSIKAGDKVTVVMNPRRDGTPGGALANVILANGTRLGSENPAAN
jgi:hypothetical protein